MFRVVFYEGFGVILEGGNSVEIFVEIENKVVFFFLFSYKVEGVIVDVVE